MASPQIINQFLHTLKHGAHEDMKEVLWSNLGGDLVLVKVGEVLEFGEDIFCSGKGLRLTPLPLLSFLPSCVCVKERIKNKRAGSNT